MSPFQTGLWVGIGIGFFVFPFVFWVCRAIVEAVEIARGNRGT